MKRILNVIFQIWCLLSITNRVIAINENSEANLYNTTTPAETIAPATIAPIDTNSPTPITILLPVTVAPVGKIVSITEKPIISNLMDVQASVLVEMKSLGAILENKPLEDFISKSRDLLHAGLNSLLEEKPFAIATVIIDVANQTLVGQTLQLRLEIEGFVSEDYQDDVELNTLAHIALNNIGPQLVLDLKATDFFFHYLTSVETVDPISGPVTASPIETLEPTNLPTDLPTLASFSFPSMTPSRLPLLSTQVPIITLLTLVPTSTPSLKPTKTTLEPTVRITLSPVSATSEPTDQITLVSIGATIEPTDQITLISTTSTPSTLSVTQIPTFSPTITPTIKPFIRDSTDAPIIPVIHTLSPSVAVDPTNLPTKFPTSTPSVTPTKSPTAAPTTRALSFFSIKLSPVTRGMTFPTGMTFREKAQFFLYERFKQLERPIEIIEIQLLGNQIVSSNESRGRSLQELTLRIDMSIQGNYVPYMKDEVVDLSKIATNFFKKDQQTFIKMLQNSEKDADAVFFANVKSLDVIEDLNFNPSSASLESNNKLGGLSVGAIIGVAVCGVLLVALVVVLLLRQNRQGEARPKQSVAQKRNNDPPRNRLQMLTPRKKKAQSTSHAQTTGQSTRSESQVPPQRLANRGSGASSGDSKYEADSVMLSDMHSHIGSETVAGADTMSYAYSLDHGIDPSLSSGNTDYYTQNSYQAAGGGAHFPSEIPMMGGRKKGNGNKISRECFAPPGKLGIVIDTSPEGPVVHKVNPGSPLEGIVWPGDIIIAIDDVDTRPLSATEITALMVENMNQRRKLAILSDAL